MEHAINSEWFRGRKEGVMAEDSVKIVKWSGKKNEYTLWSNQFLGLCALKECKDVLIGQGTRVPPSSEILDATVAADRPKIMARKANLKAYHLLLLCCSDPVSATAIVQAKTTDLPDGDAAAGWNALERLFKPDTKDNKNKLKMTLAIVN